MDGEETLNKRHDYADIIAPNTNAASAFRRMIGITAWSA
jgi:hypothetical protein